MKRHIAAQRGRQKLNHAATAISTMNILAEKLMVDKNPENPADGDESEKSSVNGDAAASETMTTDGDDPPESEADADADAVDGEGIPCVACSMIDELENMSFDNDDAGGVSDVVPPTADAGAGNDDQAVAQVAADDRAKEEAGAGQAEADEAVAASDVAEAVEQVKELRLANGKSGSDVVDQVKVGGQTEWDEKVNQLMAAGSEPEPKPESQKEVKIRVRKEPRQPKQTRQAKGLRASRRKPK